MIFQSIVKELETECRVILVGAIDENCRLPELPASIVVPLRIDLSGIKSINSVGCREWTVWLKKVQALGGIHLYRCPSVFISQVNILVGFVPEDIVIESFYVPYYCESCGAEESVLYERGKHFTDINAIVPKETIICPVCSASMGLDVVKERYFNFKSRSA